MTQRTAQMLETWCEVTLALAERHDLHTVGPPMTGLAERFVAELYGGQLAPSGQRDWDVVAPAGRIQVKALWDVGKRTRRRLGTIGTELDLLIAVVYDRIGRITEVWLVKRTALAELRQGRERVVVRLPWVRSHGERLTGEPIKHAAEAMGLDVM